MTREAELREEIEERQEGCLWKDTLEVDIEINEFIKTWTTNPQHLLDNDENAGQELRNDLVIKLLEAELKGITETNSKWKQAVQKLKEYFKECNCPMCQDDLEVIDKILGELTQ